MNKAIMVLVVLLCLPAAGQAPAPPTPRLERVPVLVAEPTYRRDSAIVITIEGLQDREFRARWIVRSLDGNHPPHFLTLHQDAGVAVWGGLGHYELIAVVAVPDWTNKTIVWHDLVARFEVVESGPDPPGPPVTPTGGFADTTKAVRSVVELVKSDGKSGEQQMIADSFAENARLSATDKDYDGIRLLEITQNNIASELGIMKFMKWKTVFVTVRSEVQRQIEKGGVKSKQDWVKLWIALAEGTKP